MPELSTLWFWMVASMFTAWAVLDGFDFGVGVLHRFVARDDAQRREVIASIGPVWDGNEVWLVAAGGSLFLSFPRLLAAGFSGFYLPMMFLAWSLILRGLAIELRNHLAGALWRSFFDTVLVVSSLAVPLLMGTLLGNVVRGVPLTAEGFFELPLFGQGVLDGYTALCGVLVLLTLTAHGANWLVLKTSGEVQARAEAMKRPLWIAALVTWAMTGVVTSRVVPEVTAALPSRPMAWLGLGAALTGAVLVFTKGERRPFFGGVAFIVGLLVTTVGCLFPVVLRSSTEPSLSLTVHNASSGATSLSTGLWWWGPGVLLAAGYLWWVLRHFRGKATIA